MNPKTTKQTLMCELTEKERREYGIALATKLGDMEEIETEKKKKLAHLAGFIPAEAEEATSTATDY